MSAPEVAGYPTDLANVITDAMTLWDECDGIDAEDPLLKECIDNGWTLAEFIALYLRRRPVEEHMAWLGMEQVRCLQHFTCDLSGSYGGPGFGWVVG